jgi:hypothetical protein
VSTAGSVIRLARDYHPTFTREQHPDPVLLRRLSENAKRLHGQVAKVSEDALAVELEESLPLADHEAGVALPACRLVTSVVAWADYASPTTRRRLDVRLIPASHNGDLAHPLASCWIVNGTLYLRGPASAWTDFDTLVVRYVAIPTDLTALTSTLPLPATADGALAADLALFMAGRSKAEDGVDRGYHAATATAGEAAYLDDVLNSITGVAFQIRDVMGYG